MEGGPLQILPPLGFRIAKELGQGYAHAITAVQGQRLLPKPLSLALLA